jgi:DNA-binding beta-propeller fold protein YncE
VALLFAGTMLASVAFVAQAADTPKPDAAAEIGRPVTVTAEMHGAGIVSSGTVLPTPPPATGTRANPVPNWGKPLPWPVVIADRRNNRLIEIAPDKRIIWEFPSPDLVIFRGNDDIYFAPDGKMMVVNEEDNYDIHFVDYAERVITRTFGISDRIGSAGQLLNYPDDAQMLSDGKMVVADIRNCRILIIDPPTAAIDTDWGRPGACRHDPPNAFGYPNGAAPLENGDILVTEIPDSWIERMHRDGTIAWAVRAPHTRYPSDAFLTQDGQVITADFVKPGGVVIFDPKTARVTWEYRFTSGEEMLDHPSLAEELPDGNVLLNDDHRHRVMVIDRQTKKIIWQYGVTDKTGHAPGYLWNPDGLDLDRYHDWKTALGGAH